MRQVLVLARPLAQAIPVVCVAAVEEMEDGYIQSTDAAP